jgi:CO dehydrogenase maturation factor
VRSVLGELLDRGDDGTDIIVDMEAGLEHLSRGTTRHVDTMLAIGEPYYRSLETARRVYELGGELGIARIRLVANKVASIDDARAIRDFAARHGMTLAAELPYAEAVVQAERQRAAFVDTADARDPLLRALGELADQLLHGFTSSRSLLPSDS